MPPRPSAPDPYVGRTIGKVRIERRIGQGGMGAVYVGTHVTLEKRMAVKLLPISPSTHRSEIQRFLREARTAARLEHPNIIQVFDVDQGDGFYYLVMQYVEGKTLSQLVKDAGRLAWIDALRIGLEIARALEVAHTFEPPVIHRDIKPANVMIGNDGSVKVLDFGLVRTLDNEEDLTSVGHVVGTATYMAPENIDGAEVDARADLYSLGVTLYLAIAGRRPFEGKSSMQVLYQQVNQPPPPLHRLIPDLPEPVESLVLRLLAKRPADRPASARALIEELVRLVGDAGPMRPARGSARVQVEPPSEESLPAVDPRRLLVGQRALEKGWITSEQLQEALDTQDQTRPTLPLGRVLQRLGYLTASQVRALLKGQGVEMEMPAGDQGLRVRDSVFGRVVVLLGLAEPARVHEALKVQAAQGARGQDVRLGEVLIERGVLTPEQVVEVLAYQRKTVFCCTHCHGYFNRKNHVAGDRVTCPKCGSPNALPDPQSLDTTGSMDLLEIRLRRLIHERRTAEESAPVRIVPPGDDDGAGDATTIDPAPVHPPAGPFLGGEVPRRQAAEFLARAIDSPSPLALVAGAPGTGKTRFGLEVPRLPGADLFRHVAVSGAAAPGPFAPLAAAAR